MKKLDPAERARRCRLLCQKLESDIASLVPEGLDGWERTFDLVAGASADFIIALAGWERVPDAAELARVRRAYDAVVLAWLGAAAQFRRERERTP